MLATLPIQKITSFFGRLPHVFSHSLQFRVRLLPLVIFCAVLMLSVRLFNIKKQLEEDVPFVTTALQAQTQTQSSPAVSTPTAPATPAANPAAPATSAPVEGAAPAASAAPEEKKPFDPLSLTHEEIKVLESLSQRRDEIDQREATIKTREQVLSTMEDKIAKKLEDLKKLKGDIQSLVKSHDDAEKAKLTNLVKIYEGMKPKEAAPIMAQLPLGVLLDVLTQMKPSKVSAIMANMDPAVASAITTELARQQELTDKALKASQGQNPPITPAAASAPNSTNQGASPGK